MIIIYYQHYYVNKVIIYYVWILQQLDNFVLGWVMLKIQNVHL